MKIKTLKDFYIITPIKDHKILNKNLLDLISKMPDNKLTTKIPNSKIENISKTDWNLPKEAPREYLTLFYKTITPYMNKMAKILQAKKWTIWNGWFQQYYKNDFHTWHRHHQSNWTNIYYIEAPHTSMLTQIKNPITNKKETVDAGEGVLVSLPAHTLHTSAKFRSKKRKTIISFNSCFHD